VQKLLHANRLLGVALAAIETGCLGASDSFVANVGSAHDDVMAQTLRVELATIETSRLLAAAGIEHRLLKGAGLAHTVALDPAQRSFRDVDLLIRGDDVDSAVALLIESNAVRIQPELRAGYDRRFAKSVTLRREQVEIDLHRVLCPGPFGVWMHPGDLFLLQRTIALAGVEIPTLDPTDHLLHACYHVALGQVEPALVNLRDIALLATGDHSIDMERFGQTVDRWRGRAVIRRAVRLAQQQLSVDLPDDLLAFVHEPVDDDDQNALDPYLDDDGSGRFAALAPATLKALPMTDRAAYALAVGLPAGSNPADRVKSILKRR